MNCKVTLPEDSVTFQARDLLDLVRQIIAEDTFTMQDIVKIDFTEDKIEEYEDPIQEDLSSLKVLIRKVVDNAERQLNRGIDLDETFKSIVTNLGYDKFFTKK